MTNERSCLSGLTPAEIEGQFTPLGLPRFRARQVAEWLYKKRITDFSEMTNLPALLRAQLQEQFTLCRCNPNETHSSKDGTEKYLFALRDGATVETVYIPSRDGRATLCVSSQVGCKMACRFCVTGSEGFGRSLTAAEILLQIYGCPHWEGLTNIVFMGQGEPLDNIDEVLRVVHLVCADYGMAWSPKRITLSTIGRTDTLRQFLDQTKCQLAISLHFADPQKRMEYMPAERRWPIKDTLRLLRHYDFCTSPSDGLRDQGSRQRRLSFEYILFEGINDGEKDAFALADLLRGFDCRVNLINLHPSPRTERLGLHRASDAQAQWFCQKLGSLGLHATIRVSRGQDIEAACGLLKARGINRH